MEEAIVFGSLTIGYMTYYFVSRARVFRQLIPRSRIAASEVLRVSLDRLVLIIGLGVVPALLLSAAADLKPADYGLTLEASWSTTAWSLGVSALAVMPILLNPRKSALAKVYPQMRIHSWTPGLIIFNLLGWAMYLLAYELMFRGMVLHVLSPLGTVAAVSIGTAIYVFAHIPKGLGESLAAIPFGIVMAVLVLRTGTIWVAFWPHLAVAAANSIISIRANPTMRVDWGNRAAA